MGVMVYSLDAMVGHYIRWNRIYMWMQNEFNQYRNGICQRQYQEVYQTLQNMRVNGAILDQFQAILGMEETQQVDRLLDLIDRCEERFTSPIRTKIEQMHQRILNYSNPR